MDIPKDAKLKIWLSVLITSCVSVFVSSLIFPVQVFQNIIWKYFWGPVVADAYGSSFVTRSSDGVNLSPTPPLEGAVAEPGYTLISTVVYALVLMFMLYGIMMFISRIDLDFDVDMALSLVPFMILGGILRIVEDINTAVYDNIGQFIIPYPLSTLLISPVIYLTLFLVVVCFVFVSEALKKRDIIEDSKKFLLYSGFATVLLTTLFIAYLTAATEIASASLIFALSSLIICTALALTVYYGIEKFRPQYNQGTEGLGFVMLWSHSLDGVVNMLSLDWSSQLGVAVQYRPKHVFNTFIRNITETIQPEALTDVIGITWPFVIVKLIIAVFLIWSFDREFRDENPYLFISLILGAIAVGLGPGSRDLIRATLGI